MQKSDIQKGRNRSFMACALRGFIVGLAVILILIAVFAALVSSGRVPQSAMSLLTWLAALFGAFTGAIAAIKLNRTRALLMGLCVSGALFLTTLIGAVFFAQGGLLGPMTPGIFVALVLGGVLGSFITLSPKKKARKR